MSTKVAPVPVARDARASTKPAEPTTELEPCGVEEIRRAQTAARLRAAPPGPLHPNEILALQSTMGNRFVSRLLAERAASAPPLQAKLSAGAAPPAPAAPQNRTGIPGVLKAGIERISGLSMDDVRVHYNSPRPASLQALAFTMGTDIHVAPGQEQHLAHEAWHVVQQKQGRVGATAQLRGAAINTESALEREADLMGARAAQASPPAGAPAGIPRIAPPAGGAIVQRKVGFEFETGVKIATAPDEQQKKYQVPYGVQVFESKAADWQIKSDNSKVEFVTKEIEENDDGERSLIATMAAVTTWARAMAALTRTANPAGSGLIKNVAPLLGDARQYQAKDVTLHTRALQDNEVVAAPQASGGVTLDRIPELIDRMITTKLSHLKYSETFKPQHAPPTAPQPTGDQDEDALKQEMHQESLLTYQAISGNLINALGAQGYDTEDISYGVGTESLITLNTLTTARAAVEGWMDQVEGFDEEERQGFEQDSGIQAANFRAETGSLQGLLSLVISYILLGSGQNAPVPYTKAVATLMSRTNFHGLYGLLTANEKRLFTTEVVLHLAGLADGNLFKAGYRSGEHVIAGPTRSAWIDSIINGTLMNVPNEAPQRLPFDLLSQGSQTPESRNSTSMGAYAQPDQNPRSQQRDLAVLEIRNMPKNQSIADWTQTALTVFEMFRQLKETKEETLARVCERRLQEESSKARSMQYVYQH